MSATTPATADAKTPDARDGRLALWLVGGGFAALIGAGALMWLRHGETVFADLVTTALAWCM